ncbi:MAG: hypothetical protein WCJ84_02075 [Candidatus Peregrinibacteria bacterium]
MITRFLKQKMRLWHFQKSSVIFKERFLVWEEEVEGGNMDKGFTKRQLNDLKNRLGPNISLNQERMQPPLKTGEQEERDLRKEKHDKPYITNKDAEKVLKLLSKKATTEDYIKDLYSTIDDALSDPQSGVPDIIKEREELSQLSAHLDAINQEIQNIEKPISDSHSGQQDLAQKISSYLPIPNSFKENKDTPEIIPAQQPLAERILKMIGIQKNGDILIGNNPLSKPTTKEDDSKEIIKPQYISPEGKKIITDQMRRITEEDKPKFSEIFENIVKSLSQEDRVLFLNMALKNIPFLSLQEAEYFSKSINQYVIEELSTNILKKLHSTPLSQEQKKELYPQLIKIVEDIQNDQKILPNQKSQKIEEALNQAIEAYRREKILKKEENDILATAGYSPPKKEFQSLFSPPKPESPKPLAKEDIKKDPKKISRLPKEQKDRLEQVIPKGAKTTEETTVYDTGKNLVVDLNPHPNTQQSSPEDQTVPSVSLIIPKNATDGSAFVQVGEITRSLPLNTQESVVETAERASAVFIAEKLGLYSFITGSPNIDSSQDEKVRGFIAFCSEKMGRTQSVPSDLKTIKKEEGDTMDLKSDFMAVKNFLRVVVGLNYDEGDNFPEKNYPEVQKGTFGKMGFSENGAIPENLPDLFILLKQWYSNMNPQPKKPQDFQRETQKKLNQLSSGKSDPIVQQIQKYLSETPIKPEKFEQ